MKGYFFFVEDVNTNLLLTDKEAFFFLSLKSKCHCLYYITYCGTLNVSSKSYEQTFSYFSTQNKVTSITFSTPTTTFANSDKKNKTV